MHTCLVHVIHVYIYTHTLLKFQAFPQLLRGPHPLKVARVAAARCQQDPGGMSLGLKERPQNSIQMVGF